LKEEKLENIKLKKLDNGITLITEHLPNVSTFSMGFFIKTGAINETKKESGISHFIEHLMFKGTKNRTAKEISEFVDLKVKITKVTYKSKRKKVNR